MQIICISLQTDNHVSISPLSFLQTGCPSCRQTNSVKAMKNINNHFLKRMHHNAITIISFLTAVFQMNLGQPVRSLFPSSTCSRKEPLERSGTGSLWARCPSKFLSPNQRFQSTRTCCGSFGQMESLLETEWTHLQQTVSAQYDNVTINSSFLWARCFSCQPTNSVKALK